MLTEPVRKFEFLLSEANGHRSRDDIMIAQGHDLPPGQVLGELTASPGTFAPYDAAASDGAEIAAGILISPINTSATGTDAATRATSIARDAEVIQSLLVGADDAAIASLLAKGIKAIAALGD